MSRTVLLKKATRIEGNADIELEIRNGEVASARFLVQDFRGLEKFLSGRRAESLPSLVSRICGLCSASQQVASLLAIEDALGIAVPPSVRALREVLVLGEWISSHALSYFFLSFPDFTGSARGIFDLMEKEPKIAGTALAVRRAGQRITELIGGRAVHPVSLAPGRFSSPPSAGDLDEAGSVARELTGLSASFIEQLGGRHGPGGQIPFPDGQRVNYLHYDSDRSGGLFRVHDRDGTAGLSFSRGEIEENISEMRADWSYAKFPYLSQMGFPDGIVLVGPLSRIFRRGGILEGPETASFAVTEQLRDPSRLSLDHYDLCRLLEIHWASLRIQDLLAGLDGIEDRGEVSLEGSGKGVGIVEAPRGVLVHTYLINEGCVERIGLLVATQFNNPFINLVIGNIAAAHIEEDSLTPDGERLVGRCIRTFDPCLSCATH